MDFLNDIFYSFAILAYIQIKIMMQENKFYLYNYFET